MTGKEILDALSAMTEFELSQQVQVILCDPFSPTYDEEHDNKYYNSESITGVESELGRITIYGYV